jgi:hypothetical protein
MANLEGIDSPSTHSSSSSDTLDYTPTIPIHPHSETPLPRRISRLGPVILQPCAEAGPSKGGQRYMYIGIRSGETPAVYTDWKQAEAELLVCRDSSPSDGSLANDQDHPNPVFKTFSTKMAADAYIKGWDGAGRHSVPVSISLCCREEADSQGSCPKPLREHLAMNFPSSVPLSSNPKRPSYHARLVASAPSLSALPETSELNTFDSRRQSFRKSQVRISSPLCRQVDEEPVVKKEDKEQKRPNWIIGPDGLFSPPASPEDSPVDRKFTNREQPSIRPRPVSGLWHSAPRQHAHAPAPRPISMLASTSTSSLRSSNSQPTAAARLSGLWTDSVPIPAPSASEPTPDFAANAPKFSRSSMRKSGVIMPAAAPRSQSSTSLRSRLTRNPSSTSLASLASSSSSKSLQTLRRPTITPKNSQDRLSALAETSMREMQVDEHGVMVFGSLAPPRPSFMKRSGSSSSIESDASGRSMSSMGSLTSASSACMSSLDSCGPIPEEVDRVQIHLDDNHHPPSCTKSDADATSQISSSAEKKPKKGGLFKRLSRALKMEKKVTLGNDQTRRGSL